MQSYHNTFQHRSLRYKNDRHMLIQHKKALLKTGLSVYAIQLKNSIILAG